MIAQGVSSGILVTSEARWFFVGCGGVADLCTAGCWAASLASTHCVSVAPQPLPPIPCGCFCQKTKNVPGLCQMSPGLGGRPHLQLRTTVVRGLRRHALRRSDSGKCPEAQGAPRDMPTTRRRHSAPRASLTPMPVMGTCCLWHPADPAAFSPFPQQVRPRISVPPFHWRRKSHTQEC